MRGRAGLLHTRCGTTTGSIYIYSAGDPASFWSAAGDAAAAGGNRLLQVLGAFPDHEAVTKIKFDPSGRFLAAASASQLDGGSGEPLSGSGATVEVPPPVCDSYRMH